MMVFVHSARGGCCEEVVSYDELGTHLQSPSTFWFRSDTAKIYRIIKIYPGGLKIDHCQPDLAVSLQSSIVLQDGSGHIE